MARIMQIQSRRGTAAAWNSANPTLADGEPGYETDSGRMKFGDGATAWTALPYQVVQPLRPSYLPKALAGHWDATTGIYRSNKGVFANAKAAMARAKTAIASNPYFRICTFGDSNTEAKMDDTTGASTAGWGTSWPDYLKALLVAGGIPDGGTGWQKPAGQISTLDTRYWTGSTGTWTGRSGQVVAMWAATTGVGNTLTLELAGGGGVAVDILTSKLNKPMTYTIYNTAGTQIATGSTVRDGTSTLLVTTITGLTDAQKLVMTSLTGTGGTWKQGPAQIRKASGLLMSQFAVSNSYAMAATPGFGWSNDTTAGSATYDWIGSEMLACEPTPDMVAGTLGGNDFLASRTNAQITADLTTIYNRYPNATRLHISNWPGYLDQASLIGAYMSMMDAITGGGAVMDNFYRDGTNTEAQARGLYKNSATIHVDEVAHYSAARAIYGALAA